MKGLIGRLAALLAGLVMAVSLLEVALRAVGFTPSYLMPDRTIGYRLAPNESYTWAGEGASRGRTNGAGWRDRDYPVAKPPGASRILMLGDSYVQALQVPLDSTFHKQLERRLNARAAGGRRVEVPAMGLGGIGTTQQYLIYTSEGRRYHPEIVALLFIPNDPADNWPVDAQNRIRPYLLDDGDSLRLDTSFVNDAGFRRWEQTLWLRRRSALFTALGQVSQRLRRRAAPNPGDAGLTDSTGWYHRWNFAFTPPADSIPAFRLTEKILALFAEEVRRDGRRFVLIVQAAPQQADSAEMAWYAANMPVDGDKTERWLRGVGARHGFDVVSLIPRFRAASGSRRLWVGEPLKYGHWNDAGHALAAEILADSLMPMIAARPVPATGTNRRTP